jgi:hypothetical protein
MAAAPVRFRTLRYQLMLWHARGWLAPFCQDCRWLRSARRKGEDYWHDDPHWYLDECLARGVPVKIVRACVDIDLNVRVRGNQTFTGIEDVHGPIDVGDEVLVREPESGVRGNGRIVEIDHQRRVVYLDVDWPSLGFAEATYATGTGQNWTWDVEHGARRVS